MEPWTYNRNVGRLRRQRKRSLNLELPKWSVGRPNEAWAPKWSVGRLRMERKRSLNVALPRQRFYQTPVGLLGFNALRIKMFATARISYRLRFNPTPFGFMKLKIEGFQGEPICHHTNQNVCAPQVPWAH